MSTLTLVPESAPFSQEQRAWLNGFLSGFIGIQDNANANSVSALATALLPNPTEHSSRPADSAEDLNDAAWHDASLPIEERMLLADGKPTPARLMAAMAQLDCGSCGYLCKSYSAAIATGEEKNLNLCTPGGQETKQMLKRVLQETPLQSSADAPRPVVASNVASVNSSQPVSNGGATSVWSRKNPFTAKMLEARPLNGTGSSKDTRHVVIDLSDSGLTYEVGDALGIYPTNCKLLVEAIIDSLSAESRTGVTTPSGSAKSLSHALHEDFCLREPSDELLELLSSRISRAESKTRLQQFIVDGVPAGFDVLDALQLAAGATITATEFVETLPPLAPRLYSIASSMRQVGNEVHLTVGKVSYEREGRTRTGVASTMLAERLAAGDELRIFTHANHTGFTIPQDDSLPMIMVGPGTGIAPFMAFLQERQTRRASGKNWLFFGDQHAACDFLYEAELTAFQTDGLLTQLDTAFSRDGECKVYVQDRMREQAAELWRWLEQGAHFYVCGDASRMAKDVDCVLKEIIASESGMSDAQCRKFMEDLVSSRRYVRDVY